MGEIEYLYGRAGFTDASEVRALLDPYEEAEAADETGELPDLIHFYGLPWREAERLLKLLPEQHARNRQNVAPSFEQFIDLGREFPEIHFHGYRITAVRWDERITIEGYLYPDGPKADALHQRVREIAGEPDEYDRARCDGKLMVRAWWD